MNEKLKQTLTSRKFLVALATSVGSAVVIGAKVAGGGHLAIEDVQAVLGPLMLWAGGESLLDIARALGGSNKATEPAELEAPANTGPKRITTRPDGGPLVAPAPQDQP